ncbi:uncharacterized protein [Rutidosis leptorrhynchoides]|uniref:uncharacterized protein n=1 Tax=Rutidosis leptorrhynchoides TaxID=125765 RepID=UPI003A99811C
MFSNFIDSRHLIEIPLLGKRFTRISDDGSKFSKLDRFLVLESFLNSWGDISVTSLDRRTSDHCPIILKDMNEDFGPKPFKIFDLWLECIDVELVIVDAWNKEIKGSRCDCVFRNKMKNVKEALREWSKHQYSNLDVELDTWKKTVENLEIKAEQNTLTDTELEEWLNARVKWLSKEKEKAEMLRQKARLNCIAEGDDNTSSFHSTIRRKNNSSNIRGLNLNGKWEEKPTVIKEEVHKYFSHIFENKQTTILDFESLNSPHFNTLDPTDVLMLEAPNHESELWNAIKDCEPSKAGLDRMASI